MQKYSVFQIGGVGVGKTTLIGLICKFINDNPEYLIRSELLSEFNDRIGILVYDYLMNTFKKASFPARTSLGSSHEIKLPFLMKGGKEFLLEFVDFSGEDIRDFCLDKRFINSFFKEPEVIKHYLYSYNVIFLVADISSASSYDKPFSEALSKIWELFKEEKKIALIINKWDEIHPSVNLKEFIQKQFVNTLSTVNVLGMKNVKFFKSSVGKVFINQSHDTEFRLNFTNIKNIVDWLINEDGKTTSKSEENIDLDKIFYDDKPIRKKIEKLLEKNDFYSAFEVLLAQVKDGKDFELIVGLKSRYNKVNSLKRKGVIDINKFILEENLIRNTIFELTSEL